MEDDRFLWLWGERVLWLWGERVLWLGVRGFFGWGVRGWGESAVWMLVFFLPASLIILIPSKMSFYCL